MSLTRADFLRLTRNLACGACLGSLFGRGASGAEPSASAGPDGGESLRRAKQSYEFAENWLADFMAELDAEVDAATRVRLFEACGRGCYRRHPFKQAIAAEGRGDLDRLLGAYRRNFNIERVGDVVHIWYGDHCYCPAAQGRPARRGDLQCECTKATHQAIFEEALGRRPRADIAESIRRGGKTCHIRIYLS